MRSSLTRAPLLPAAVTSSNPSSRAQCIGRPSALHPLHLASSSSPARLTIARAATQPSAWSQEYNATPQASSRSFATLAGRTKNASSSSPAPSTSASSSAAAGDPYAPIPPTLTHTETGLWIDKTLPRPFRKVLIANRGEIACRVIRTCRQLQIATVAVYSDADADAQHVHMADEAYRIGEPLAAKSYLLGDKILAVAKACGAEAIHPGYGFLSENAGFARACEQSGIVFIGPPASAIDAMGSKSASKQIMTAASVPVVPGYHGAAQDVETLQREAEQVGYPIMMKAWMGGGGKGMRIVRSPDEFVESLQGCQREAQGAFGDDRVLLERYVVRPRHIEFQVFCDRHGGAVHLYERDCSVQRRHQKVLEEAPAPGMTAELRSEMGKAAVNAALAVGYVGAGTVEFLFDAESGEYYFMEMNTRLQVEHPVTEMIMRRDLVQWQLHVAAGHRLPAAQSALRAIGNAIEARVYAENPYNGFLPATGHIHHLRAPPLSPTVRVESAVREGDAISIYYDPMISKLVCWGETRERALDRMEAALRQYEVSGVLTNVPFLLRCVAHPRFRQGQVETGFIAENLRDLIPQSTADSSDVPTSLAALAILLRRARAARAADGGWQSAWARPDHFRLNVASAQRVRLERLTYDADGELKATPVDVAIVTHDPAHYMFTVGSRSFPITGRFHPASSTAMTADFLDQSHTASIAVSPSGQQLDVFVHGEHYRFQLPVVTFTRGAVGGGGCVSPMAGRVVKVSAEAGQAVKKGAALVVMEAMKMEHVIRAPADAVVQAVLYREGDFVEGGKTLVQFEPAADKQ